MRELTDTAGLAAEVAAALGAERGAVAVELLPSRGVALAAAGRSWAVATADPAAVLGEVERSCRPRWTWWSAADAVPAGAGDDRLGSCWDLGAVHRLLHGPARTDPAGIWAAAHQLPLAGAPLPAAPVPGALDFDGAPASGEPARADGQLSDWWAGRRWRHDDDPAGAWPAAVRWAELALRVRARQQVALAAVADPRAAPAAPALPLLTAWSESAAALLCVELQRCGLPVDRGRAVQLIGEVAGPAGDAPTRARARSARDSDVTRHLPAGTACDLRNPASVRAALDRIGIEVADTRSHRLERYRDVHPFVAALLRWRKAERITTTYGYDWLARHVGPDGRLRGEWGAADAAAGRMTASAGLHNLPALLRAAVVAEPGHVFVRADLGQVEPRVLAVVAADPALAAATRADDFYAPVAAALRCDRPTAKVAVLAAMYGQTSGPAGRALRDMERSFPRALGYLREAEQAGREGRAVRTWGGRLVGAGVTDPSGRFVRNAMVQGAAAELFKSWAAAVRAGLPAGAEIVLCLHDELLVHAPAELAELCRAVLLDALADTSARWSSGAGVRFVADTAVVQCWADAKA